jgi:cell division protein FtsL
LASLSHAQSSIVEPVVRPRPRTKPRTKQQSKTRKRTQARARGGILWIVVSGILLTGVVFVNVAVLRLNLSLDSTNSERTKLRAENALLQSNLSRELASSQIQTRAAKEFGLTYADPTQYGYVNLARK